MFDRVIADFKCPYCGFKLVKGKIEKTLGKRDDTWQTKATAKLLEIYKIGDKLKFYKVKIEKGWMDIHHVCPECDKFVQAEILPTTKVIRYSCGWQESVVSEFASLTRMSLANKQCIIPNYFVGRLYKSKMAD